MNHLAQASTGVLPTGALRWEQGEAGGQFAALTGAQTAFPSGVLHTPPSTASPGDGAASSDDLCPIPDHLFTPAEGAEAGADDVSGRGVQTRPHPGGAGPGAGAAIRG